jgi:WD40 repeat protein
MAFSPDGRTLVTAHWRDTLQLWNIPTRREVATLKTQGEFDALGVAFSPDGKFLAACGFKGLVQLWRAPTFERGVQRNLRHFATARSALIVLIVANFTSLRPQPRLVSSGNGLTMET